MGSRAWRAGRNSSAAPKQGANHPLHPFGTYWVPLPWEQLRGICWQRHLWWAILTSAGNPSHITCCAPRMTGGLKTRTYWYFNKKQQKTRKNWHDGEVLPCPDTSIVSLSLCHLLQSSGPLQSLPWHGLSHLPSSSTVPKAAAGTCPKCQDTPGKVMALGGGGWQSPCDHNGLHAWGDQT